MSVPAFGARFFTDCHIFIGNTYCMYLQIFWASVKLQGHTGQTLGETGQIWVQVILLTCNFEADCTVYPKKYAHGFCFAVLCCGYTLTDFPTSIRLTSLALWQSNDCPSASKATLTNMDKYFMWIHYERLHNHNKAKHNKTVCIFLGIYCTDLCLGHLLLNCLTDEKSTLARVVAWCHTATCLWLVDPMLTQFSVVMLRQ